MFNLKTLVVVGLILVVGNIAGAAYVQYSATVDPASPNTLPWDKTATFQKFNTSLGHLDSVTLSLTTSLVSTLTATNASPTNPSTGTVWAESNTVVADRGGYLTQTLHTTSDTYAFSLAGGQQSTDPDTKVGIKHLDNSSLPSGLISELTNSGGGTAYLTMDATNAQAKVITSVDTGIATGSASTDVVLTGFVGYTYTVPEPATMSLLALGGLALLKRRRK